MRSNRIDRFFGLYPSRLEGKLPVGASEICENVLFRRNGITPAPKAKLKSQNGPFVVPNGNYFVKWDVLPSWYEMPDRVLVFKDGYPLYLKSTNQSQSNAKRVGFAFFSARTYQSQSGSSVSVAATAARTSEGTGTDTGKEYLFYIQYQNGEGDLSELSSTINVASNHTIKLAGTVKVVVSNPVPKSDEDMDKIHLFASTAGESPRLVKTWDYDSSVEKYEKDFTPNSDYSSSVRRTIYANTSSDGRTTSIPAGAKGMLRHPNGFYVVWHGEYLSFSDKLSTIFPYDWDLHANFEIDNVIEYNNDLWVYGVGEPPLVVRMATPQTIQVITPEVNFYYNGGAAKGTQGVFYFSDAGLTHSQGEVVTKDKYNKAVVPSVKDAVVLNDSYFGMMTDGIILIDGRARYEISELKFASGTHRQLWTKGEKIFFTIGKSVYELDFASKVPSRMHWKSGIIRLSRPTSQGAIRVFGSYESEEEESFGNGIGVEEWTTPIGLIGNGRAGIHGAKESGDLTLWGFNYKREGNIVKRNGRIEANGRMVDGECKVNVKGNRRCIEYQFEVVGNVGIESIDIGPYRKALEILIVDKYGDPEK